MKRTLLLLAALTGCASRPDPAAPGAGMRVLTYNIHAGKDAAQVHNLERVSALIYEQRADLVLLQEVDRGTRRSGGEDQLALLARLTGMHAVFGKSLDYDGGLYGIAILSRFPIDSVRVIPLEVQPPQERSGRSYEPRIGLHAIVRTPGGRIHLINTHIDPAGAPTYRHQELIQLLAYIQRNAAREPVIFGGDLNARPATPEIAALGLAFADSWAGCGGGGPGYTFPAHAPDRRIDYLLLRRARCTSAQVSATEASDHRPLLATIVIEG